MLSSNKTKENEITNFKYRTHFSAVSGDFFLNYVMICTSRLLLDTLVKFIEHTNSSQVPCQILGIKKQRLHMINIFTSSFSQCSTGQLVDRPFSYFFRKKNSREAPVFQSTYNCSCVFEVLQPIYLLTRCIKYLWNLTQLLNSITSGT